MKIVKFKNGKYGIRRRFLGFLWYQYKDLTGNSLWWSISSPWMKDCIGTYEQCREILHDQNDTGTPLND